MRLPNEKHALDDSKIGDFGTPVLYYTKLLPMGKHNTRNSPHAV